jgi:hypothetical protein
MKRFMLVCLILGSIILCACGLSTEARSSITPTSENYATPEIYQELDSHRLDVMGSLHVFLNLSSEEKLYPLAGDCVYADGIYHLWFMTYSGEPTQGAYAIRYAVSTDLANWSLANDPVVEGTFEDELVYFLGSVLRAPEGGWEMYLTAKHPGSTLELEQAEADLRTNIFRLTAASPQGPWTWDATPAIDLGEMGLPDFQGVEYPLVVWDGELRRMVYQTSSDIRPYPPEYEGGIFGSFTKIAVSIDGELWLKVYPDVLLAGGIELSEVENYVSVDIRSWEEPVEFMLDDLWRDEGGWHAIIYRHHSYESEMLQGLLLAFSMDGIEWTPENRLLFFLDGILEGKAWANARVFFNGQQAYLLVCTSNFFSTIEVIPDFNDPACYLARFLQD